VAILAPGTDEPSTLSPSDEKELSQALEEIHGGNFVDGWTLIKEIKAKSRGSSLRYPEPGSQSFTHGSRGSDAY